MTDTTSEIHSEIQASAAVTVPRLERSSELELRVTLTNIGTAPVRLNTLFFPYAQIQLRIVHADGTPTDSGPPPLPPHDDGSTGRVVFAPGDVLHLVYRGAQYLVNELPPGRYRVRFRHVNDFADDGDWTGVAASDWQAFEIVESSAAPVIAG